MCSETFLRLPEEKRNRFLDAAWEEFTGVSFEKASINQIVQRARIPRGSFYQYFADKGALFAYLQEQVLTHLLSGYRKVIKQAGGDIFETQMRCFDRVVTLGGVKDVIFDRSIQIARKNPGLLPQIIMAGKLLEQIFEMMWDVIDTSGFRNPEKTLVGHVFCMTLMSLAVSVAACLEHPEESGRYRHILMTDLDIIKYGCMAEPGRDGR